MAGIDPVAVVAGLAALIPGAAFTIGLAVKHDWPTARRWFQNWPTAGTYVLTAFPLAVALLTVSIVRYPPSIDGSFGRAIAIALASAVVLLAIVAAWKDFLTTDPNPVLLKEGIAQEVIRSELGLRAAAGKRAPTARHREAYRVLVLPFQNVKGLRERANWLAIPLFVENVLGGVVVAAFIAYLSLWALFGLSNPDGQPSALSLATGTAILLATWIPFRLYSLWYQFAIYKPDWKAQQVFMALSGLLLLVAGILVFLKNSGPISVSIAAVIAAAGGLLALGERLKWNWVTSMLRTCAGGIESCDFTIFGILFAALMIACLLVAKSATYVPSPTGHAPALGVAAHAAVVTPGRTADPPPATKPSP